MIFLLMFLIVEVLFLLHLQARVQKLLAALNDIEARQSVLQQQFGVAEERR